jgi:hypothetical protein
LDGPLGIAANLKKRFRRDKIIYLSVCMGYSTASVKNNLCHGIVISAIVVAMIFSKRKAIRWSGQLSASKMSHRRSDMALVGAHT